MKPIQVKVDVKKILGDTLTPVSVYLKFRDLFPKSVLLESSDYHGNENAYSFICIKPLAGFEANEGEITVEYPGGVLEKLQVEDHFSVAKELNNFYKTFQLSGKTKDAPANGLFGYLSYDSVKYFEKIEIKTEKKDAYAIPEVRYHFYKYILAIDHAKDMISLIENLPEGETSEMNQIESLLKNLTFPVHNFRTRRRGDFEHYRRRIPPHGNQR